MDTTQEYHWCPLCHIWGDENHQENFHVTIDKTF